MAYSRDAPTVRCNEGSFRALDLERYRGYLRTSTRTALGSYSRAMPRSIAVTYRLYVSLFTSDPCTYTNNAHHTPYYLFDG